MPPQQAGEISMRMHSGEQKQPLPCQVPAISFGESSLGRSRPRLMGAHDDEFARRGALSWSSLLTGAESGTATKPRGRQQGAKWTPTELRTRVRSSNQAI